MFNAANMRRRTFAQNCHIFLSNIQVFSSGSDTRTEDTKVKYVEASSITVTASEQEVTDLSWLYIGYGENYNSINTGTTGVLEKDATTGLYFVSTPYISQVIIETPFEDISALEGKIVTVKGYTNGTSVADNEDITYGFILTSIEEVEFELNPNWTLSYEGEYSYYGYTFENILNTVSAGEDYYVNYISVPSLYPVDTELTADQIKELATTEALTVADEIQFWFSRYGDTIDDDATVETGSLYPTAATEFGKYIVFATGLTEEGYPSGKYQYLIFEKKDPYVAADYDDFIGEWRVSSTITWTISENVKDESYKVSGIPGLDKEIIAQYEDGKVSFYEQDIEGDASSSYGTVSDIVFGGGFTYNSTNYWNYKYLNGANAERIMQLAMNVDGSVDVINIGHATAGTNYVFTYFGFWGILQEDAGNNAGRVLVYSRNSFPSKLTWVDPDEVIDPLQLEYTSDDLSEGISMQKLTSTNWIAYAKYDFGEGWSDSRKDVALVKATDIEDEDGEDLLTLSGLSMGAGEEIGFDDSILFDLYDGAIFSHVNGVSPILLEGDPYYVHATYVDEEFTTDEYDYDLVGEYVAEGIFALVSYYGDGIDGILYQVAMDENMEDIVGGFCAIRSILLVDPAILTDANAANASIQAAKEKISHIQSALASKKITSSNKAECSRQIKELLREEVSPWQSSFTVPVSQTEEKIIPPFRIR